MPYEKVWDLKSQSLSSKEISKRLNLTLEQVLYILYGNTMKTASVEQGGKIV